MLSTDRARSIELIRSYILNDLASRFRSERSYSSSLRQPHGRRKGSIAIVVHPTVTFISAWISAVTRANWATRGVIKRAVCLFKRGLGDSHYVPIPPRAFSNLPPKASRRGRPRGTLATGHWLIASIAGTDLALCRTTVSGGPHLRPRTRTAAV